MKKRYWAVPLAIAAVAAAGAVYAANLANLSGQSCGSFSGTWHFVNNQVPAGSPVGTLTATWDSGDTCTVAAGKVLSSVQHFYCTGSGALTGASTNLGGRLLLSDYSCQTKCDPKTDPKCTG